MNDDRLIAEDTVYDVEMVTKDNRTRVFFRHGKLYMTGRNLVTYKYPILEFHSGGSTALGRALRVVADRIDPPKEPLP